MLLPETFSLLLWSIMILYGSIILVFTIGLVKSPYRSGRLSTRTPGFVSVIVPVRNEEGNILRILDELCGQDFPADLLEVIVTDDFSTDDTMAIAGRYAIGHPEFPLIMVSSKGADPTVPGKKMAIERAVAKAQGEILLFTDADTFRGYHWISSMVSGFGSSGVQMVLGPVYFCHEKNLLQKIQSLEFLGLMGTTAGSAALGFPVMCNGANLAYRRDAFFQTGGFSANLQYSSGDDQFIMSSIRKHYGRGAVVFSYHSLSSVGTEPEATLAGFFNQRIRWVSKSRGYRDPVVIFVGIVTWLTHFLLLTGILTGFCFPMILSLSLLLWFVKILMEYPMVWIMIRFFERKKLPRNYVIAQVFQLVYVPLAGMLGLFLPYRWKGRKG
jgi:cellulose synthase/poly-beta-1,6-N-acetylglucosamine synthase-like glycosyltransferase